MPAETQTAVELEIGHVLFIDAVGYSKLLMHEQRELCDCLNYVVRNSSQFQNAEASGKLIRLPTGDGMALVFLDSPETPVRCAIEISRAARGEAHLPLRMGIHSGPVSRLIDVNNQSNVAGAGVNVAQRVMAFGDAGHILLSKRAAEDLTVYRDWQPFLQELGEYEVKHGNKVSIVNLFTGDVGNPQLPDRCRALHQVARQKSRHRRNVALVSAAALLLVTAVILAWYVQRTAAGAISTKSIAVLPFVSLSEDKQNEFFTDGVQDEILNDLAKVSDLRVISRTSAMQYKNAAARNLRQIGKELGVAHVVEGTVQRVGNRVRVSAQLIDARTDTHIWAEHYDTELPDVFRIQSELAEQIANQLKAKLSPAERAAIEENPTDDVAAYELYLRARNLIDSRAFNAHQKEDFLQATQLLEQAIDRDKNFLLAHYQLATAHDLIYFDGFDHTPERLAKAEVAVNNILRLRPDSGQAHLAVAQHLYLGYRDYDRARQELEIAQRLLPNEPQARILAGYIDRRQGRWQQSIEELESALQLDPRNVSILQQVSFTYESLRRFEDMARVLDRVLAITPNDDATRFQRAFVDLEQRADTKPAHALMQSILENRPAATASVADRWTYLALYERDVAAGARATALISAGGISENGINFPRSWYEGLFARLRNDNAAAGEAWTRARAEVGEVVRLNPGYAEPLSVLGMIDASLGRKKEAVEEGRRAVALLPVAKDAMKGALLIEYLAVIYATLGDTDSAIEQLTVATRIPGDVNYGQLQLYPYWDPIRNDPRFQRLISTLAPDK